MGRPTYVELLDCRRWMEVKVCVPLDVGGHVPKLYSNYESKAECHTCIELHAVADDVDLGRHCVRVGGAYP